MAKRVAAPPLAVVFHVDEACSADELELDVARYCYDESVFGQLETCQSWFGRSREGNGIPK